MKSRKSNSNLQLVHIIPANCHQHIALWVGLGWVTTFPDDGWMENLELSELTTWVVFVTPCGATAANTEWSGTLAESSGNSQSKSIKKHQKAMELSKSSNFRLIIIPK